MPELPEVETVVRDLRPLLVGRRFVALRVGRRKLRRPWKRDWAARLVGATVAGVRRRGKWIVLDLDAGPRLVVHLGMTGQFTVAKSDEAMKDHTHLVFELNGDAGELRFRDARRFGSVELFADEAAVRAFLADRLGPEPAEIDPVAFREALQRTGRTLKAVLLDQTVVAGVGNIYADEALFRAGLHPQRRGQTVTAAEADRLREAVAAVIADAIEHRGSTIRDYVGGSGLRGGYQDEFRVYGRTGKPCPACAAVIEVVRVAGRSSHYCPGCQKNSPQRARRAQR
ncbi:MAG TPA: bifunctional DNA-formamidopyrimidine glycosylase/DNA-(apurinic or apyrimidinic site) lyase [Fimbriiglobus sp.]|jgi:formamidopyrimidine-DNA glycosylase|nr:bifunctional DNA-formamidopyrimidine glycosylase/DNA-(apurinic or apyrimidinic site) lyase [Fimbriiglobus sp.]